MKTKNIMQQIKKTLSAKTEIPAIVYSVQLKHKDEIFVKVGVTTKQDFNHHTFSVYEVISEPTEQYFDSFDEAKNQMKQILIDLKKNHYVPKYSFGGSATQCVR